MRATSVKQQGDEEHCEEGSGHGVERSTGSRTRRDIGVKREE